MAPALHCETMLRQGSPSRFEQWTTEPREPGPLGRLIAPQSGGKPATMAFLIGVLAAAAFVGSLSLDWLSVSTTQPSEPPPAPSTQTYGHNITDVFMLGLVYTLGGVAQLGIVGAVITRSEAALRLRMGAVGVGVGLLGIVLAATIRLPGQLGQQLESAGASKVSFEPGIFCAYAAVVLPTVAIWLVSRPAAREAHERDVARAETHARQGAEEADHIRSNLPTGGLTVSASEPLDLSVTPDGGARER